MDLAQRNGRKPNLRVRLDTKFSNLKVGCNPDYKVLMDTFSRLYLDPPKLSPDSPRARARVGAYCERLEGGHYTRLIDLLDQELGVQVGFGYRTSNVRQFFVVCSNSEFLDAITFAIQAVNASRDRSTSRDLVAFIERVFREENLPYRIGTDACVHPLVDDAFDRERQSILAALGDPKYLAARQAMQLAFDSLKPDGSGTLQAVLHSFEAIENVFKQAFPEKRLGATELQRQLEPIVKSLYSGRAADAGVRLVAAFREYVNAMHQYRHADNEPEPTPPTMSMSVLLISQCTANLRWLLQMKDKTV